MPVLPVQWYVGVGPTCSLYTPAMTIWALIQMITVACCWKVSTNHISNIQYSRKHKNVMNVMWRVEKLRVSWLAWHRWHWPGQNPETRCDMLTHTRESIFIHVIFIQLVHVRQHPGWKIIIIVSLLIQPGSNVRVAEICKSKWAENLSWNRYYSMHFTYWNIESVSVSGREKYSNLFYTPPCVHRSFIIIIINYECDWSIRY